MTQAVISDHMGGYFKRFFKISIALVILLPPPARGTKLRQHWLFIPVIPSKNPMVPHHYLQQETIEDPLFIIILLKIDYFHYRLFPVIVSLYMDYVLIPASHYYQIMFLDYSRGTLRLYYQWKILTVNTLNALDQLYL